MRQLRCILLLSSICLLIGGALAAPVFWKDTVDGVTRTALVYPGVEAKKVPSPLVFAFHGFTGHSWNMARMSRLHEAWPEATVVYPQGLMVNSPLLKRDGPGWQHAPGRDGDRDVKFLDALYADLCEKYRVDPQRVYATGMSNGALFCYVLLAARPERFAAFAPVAGAAGFAAKPPTVPRPVLIIQGKNDTLVKPSWAEATRDLLRRLNGCGEEEKAWAPGYISYQPCASGQPVIWRLHDGGHIWPPDATRHIVRFFKEMKPKEVPSTESTTPK